MNCKEAEKSSILYSELAIKEKTLLEEHIKNCTVCALRFEAIQSHQEIISKLTGKDFVIENPIAFTDQIMAALPQKSPKHKKRFFAHFNWTPLQTSLAACSLMLIISFTIEFNALGDKVEQQAAIKNGIPLTINPEKLIQSKRARTNLFSLEKMITKNSSIAYSE